MFAKAIHILKTIVTLSNTQVPANIHSTFIPTSVEESTAHRTPQFIYKQNGPIPEDYSLFPPSQEKRWV